MQADTLSGEYFYPSIVANWIQIYSIIDYLKFVCEVRCNSYSIVDKFMRIDESTDQMRSNESKQREALLCKCIGWYHLKMASSCSFFYSKRFIIPKCVLLWWPHQFYSIAFTDFMIQFMLPPRPLSIGYLLRENCSSNHFWRQILINRINFWMWFQLQISGDQKYFQSWSSLK